MKRPAPFHILTLIIILSVGFFAAITQAQTPLPYEAVPVAEGSSPTPTPVGKTFSDPGTQTPFVNPPPTQMAQVIQPSPETVPQPLSTGYPPTYSGGGPVITQPVPQMGAPSGGTPYGLYDQGYGRSGWITGFAFVFLKPHYNNNNAFFVRSTAGGPGADVNAELDWSAKVSPRIWVEYVGADDFGARVTYWQFDHDSGNAGLTAAGTTNFITRNFITANGAVVSVPGDTIAVGSALEMHTIDAEFTQRMKLQKWQANVGGGFRHASVHQSYGAIGTMGAAPMFTTASHRFDGIGPTVFAELRRPIWSSGFSLIASARGSFLYGNSKLDVTNTIAPAGGGVGTASINSTNGQVVPVGEIQLGAEWSTWMSNTTLLYFQLAWEGQYWAGVGNAGSRTDDLGLFGFNTSVGLEW